jgi:hypothetical protein
LNPDSYQRARQFIKKQARPLDRTIFEHRFEAGPLGAVVAALGRYQNPDGGFGHALEPDLRTPSSSALATGHALTILKGSGVTADHEIVRRALAYLGESLDPQARVWRVVALDANEHPHAPWWHDENGSLARTFDGYRIIPRAQIVGLLWHYTGTAPMDWLEPLTEQTVSDIETIEPFGTGGGDDLHYALSLAETEALPERFKARLVVRLRKAIPAAVSRDPAQWRSYSIRPLKVVASPASIAADLLRDEVQANLDYLIDEQTPEGSWDPVWSWGDAYPADWEQARLEWRGHLTLEALKKLQAFGRIPAV